MNRLATALFETGTNANESEVQESTVQSARLPRDRHHLALLTSAQRQLKAGDVTAAIDTLQQILNADNDSFVLVGKKRGSGLVCRNGPQGAAHKRVPTPFFSLAFLRLVDDMNSFAIRSEIRKEQPSLNEVAKDD